MKTKETYDEAIVKTYKITKKLNEVQVLLEQLSETFVGQILQYPIEGRIFRMISTRIDNDIVNIDNIRSKLEVELTNTN